MNRCIKKIDTGTYTGFKKSFKQLPEDIKNLARQALQDLIKDPQPKHLRLEKLRSNNKPPLYSIHITRNHSHKISFELDGDIAVLRKAGTHKEIDRHP